MPYANARPLRSHRSLAAYAEPALTDRFGPDKARQFAAEAEAEFAAHLQEIPYVGGDRNPFTDTLVQTASILTIYRVLKRQGMSTEEIGCLTESMAERRVTKVPGFLRRLLGWFYMSPLNRRRVKRNAAISQRRQYPGDFVYQVIDEAGDSYQWGVDYIECGIVKYLQANGAGDLAPYLCQMDYLLFPAIGIELVRTGTIGRGCERCDFRFNR